MSYFGFTLKIRGIVSFPSIPSKLKEHNVALICTTSRIGVAGGNMDNYLPSLK